MSVRYFEKDGKKYQVYIKNGKEYTREYKDNKNKISDDIKDIYLCWRYMRKRCQAQNAPYSRYYFKKGITVCDEWNNLETGLNNFIEWSLKNGYEKGLSIDRIDSSKGYNPSNCRWISIDENKKLGVSQKHVPKWEYIAYNKDENLLLIFYKIIEFRKYTGLDERRVPDGCKDSEYTYKGWKFSRRAINVDYYESQETIPVGSTLEDELPMEVRIIRLPIESDKDIVHSA